MIELLQHVINKLRQEGLENVVNRYYGEYLSEVTKVENDTEKNSIMYEIKVFAINSEEPITNLAYYGSPYAGKNFGYQFPLQVGDYCWVSFDHGDTGFPKIVNSHWAEGERPEQLNSEKKIGLVSRDGHHDVLDEEAKTWVRKMKEGSHLTFKEKDVEFKSVNDMLIDTDGSLNIKVKKMIDFLVTEDFKAAITGNCKIDAKKTTMIVSDKLELGAEGAGFSAVKYEILFSYLNTAMGMLQGHVHPCSLPGQISGVPIPVPSLPDSSMKSEKVKLA